MQGLVGCDTDTTSALEIAEITKTVRDCTPGAALILGADSERCNSMIRGLKNASLAGRDEWPKNVTEAHNCASKWEGDEPTGRAPREHQETSFLNDHSKDTKTHDTEPQDWHVKMTCRNCSAKGDIASFCPDAKLANTNVQDGEIHPEGGAQLIDGTTLSDENEDCHADLFLCEEDQEHKSVSFQLKDGINGGRIPKDWVPLDSQSTPDAFSNPALLRDTHEARSSLTIHTQAGKAVTKLRGTVPGCGEMWFCRDGIAKISSLARGAKTRVVTFDSTNGNQFAATKDDGTQ
jgi:hypothetical protein